MTLRRIRPDPINSPSAGVETSCRGRRRNVPCRREHAESQYQKKLARISEIMSQPVCELCSLSSRWLFLTIASVLKGEVRAVCSPPKRVRLPRAMELPSKGERRETTV